MKCRDCDFTATNPHAIGVHKRDVHGAKPKSRKKKKPSEPVVLAGPQIAEEDLLANVVGWFEQAQQTPAACARVLSYLSARYAPPPPLIHPFAFSQGQQINGAATSSAVPVE